MTLGLAGQLKVWHWNGSAWVDYSGNLFSLRLQEEKSTPTYLKVKLLGVAKATISRHDKIAVSVGVKTPYKFEVEQADYTTKGELNLTCYIHAGGNADNLNMIYELSEDKVYDKQDADDIITDLCSSIAIDGTDDGGNTEISVEVKNEQVTQVLTKICSRLGMWWKIVPASIDTANEGTATLHVFDTPYTTVSGTQKLGEDIFNNKDNEEGRDMYTHIVGVGSARDTSLLHTEGFIPIDMDAGATIKRSKLSNPVDTLLTSALASDEDTTITVDDTSGFLDAGTIKIGSEYIDYTSKTSTTLVGAGGTLVRGADGTQATDYKVDDEVLNYGTDSNDIPITVGDASDIDGNNLVRIGSELFTVNSTSGEVMDCTRGASSSQVYAHYTDEMYVYDGSYTIDSPETDSPIDEEGKRSKKKSVINARHLHEIDMDIHEMLESAYAGITIQSVTVVDPFNFIDTKAVELGSQITISDDILSISAADYLVSAITIDWNHGVLKVTMGLTNTITELQTEIRDYSDVSSATMGGKLKGFLDTFLTKNSENSVSFLTPAALTISRTAYLGTQAAIFDSQNYYFYIGDTTDGVFGITCGTDTITSGLLVSSLSGNSILSATGDGSVTINDAYTFPLTAGTDKYILQTDGAGSTSWVANSGTSFWTDEGSYLQASENDIRLDDSNNYVRLYGSTGNWYLDTEAANLTLSTTTSYDIIFDTATVTAILGDNAGSEYFRVADSDEAVIFSVDSVGETTTADLHVTNDCDVDGDSDVGGALDVTGKVTGTPVSSTTFLETGSYRVPNTSGSEGQVLKWPEFGTILVWDDEASGSNWTDDGSVLSPNTDGDGWQITNSTPNKYLNCIYQSESFELYADIAFRIYTSAGNMIIENTSATDDIWLSLGDTAGATALKVAGSDDSELLIINSDGDTSLYPSTFTIDSSSDILFETDTKIGNKLHDAGGTSIFYVLDSTNDTAFAVTSEGNAQIGGAGTTSNDAYLALVGTTANNGQIVISEKNSTTHYLSLGYNDTNSAAWVYGSETLYLEADDGVALFADVGSGSAMLFYNNSGSKTLMVMDYSANCWVYNGLSVSGALSKGSGTFKIDHPLDPYNKTLYHGLVEGPEYMNMYRFKVDVKKNDRTTVELPDYFWALNENITVQITPIEKLALSTYYVDESLECVEVESNEDCTLHVVVMGSRKDAFIKHNPFVLEEEKEEPFLIHDEIYENGAKDFSAQTLDLSKIKKKYPNPKDRKTKNPTKFAEEYTREKPPKMKETIVFKH